MRQDMKMRGVHFLIAREATGIDRSADNREAGRRGLFRAAGAAALGLMLSLYPTFSSQAATNAVTIHEVDGVTTTNYPLQLGRVFVQGEIPHAPQVLVDGVPVLTQADVKTRWLDGSVQHAIMNCYISTMPAHGTVTLTFQDQPTSQTGAGLTVAEMLDPAFDFEAAMQFTNGTTTLTASARRMLQDGSFTRWLDGPIATSIILADHSIGRTYDVGFDTYRSIRPMFLATFWPAVRKVQVRYIGEISNTEVLQDQTYDLTLLLGFASPSTVYAKAGLLHHPATRWTKSFWIGGTPSTLDINHHLDYLVSTKLIPNFDVSKVIPASVISANYNAWLSKPHDLYDIGGGGYGQPYMGSTNWGRKFGWAPGWITDWLYSGDHRAEEIARGQADLGAAWPMQYREGNPAKHFDRAKTISGLGRVISISERPTLQIPNAYSTKTQDRITPVNPPASNPWTPDNAHQPDTYTMPYLLTGDLWYLEQLHFWAGWSAAMCTAGGNTHTARGPTGVEGAIYDQIRGEAWAFRTRVNAATFTPDGWPEKAYFKQLLEDAIAAWEGQRDLQGTHFENTTMWTWGKNVWTKSDPHPTEPLHFWDGYTEAYASSASSIIDPTKADRMIAPWMQSVLIAALAQARDMGYPTQALLSWVAVNEISMMSDPDASPYYMGVYRLPTADTARVPFATWRDVKAATIATFNPQAQFNNYMDLENGYSTIAIAGIAAIADQPGGAAAWSWIQAHSLNRTSMNNNPKWAILPRQRPPSGDLDGDGKVALADVRAMIQMLLGQVPVDLSKADLNGDGRLSLADLRELLRLL